MTDTPKGYDPATHKLAGKVRIALPVLHDLLDLPDNVRLTGVEPGPNGTCYLALEGPGLPVTPRATIEALPIVMASVTDPARRWSFTEDAGYVPKDRSDG